MELSDFDTILALGVLVAIAVVIALLAKEKDPKEVSISSIFPPQICSACRPPMQGRSMQTSPPPAPCRGCSPGRSWPRSTARSPPPTCPSWARCTTSARAPASTVSNSFLLCDLPKPLTRTRTRNHTLRARTHTRLHPARTHKLISSQAHACMHAQPVAWPCMARAHAAEGGSYSQFVALDASRAYVTGDFKGDLNDNIEGLSNEQLASLLEWSLFYQKVRAPVLAHPDLLSHQAPRIRSLPFLPFFPRPLSASTSFLNHPHLSSAPSSSAPANCPPPINNPSFAPSFSACPGVPLQRAPHRSVLQC